MRLLWTYILIILLLYLNGVPAVKGDAISPRDPNESSSAATSPPSSASASFSSNVASPSTQSSGSPKATLSTSIVSSSTEQTTAVSTAPAATSAIPTEILSIDDGSLPLSPELTPAMGLAGAFLMLSGVIYNLIGIKNKAIQIFISTAYLIALAITVLLIYVIDPPITDAVQAAYFVAAFVPAVGLGGVALIFKDVTEGLGSAAGGFALSMWFLVLKAGGVLTSTAAKAIFIGCWTAGVYILYFSHHIRSYVIIGATSFAGSTAVILGIDCFSLAGLKEFWVYIWGLNGKLFPPEQDTYPITRGMTVEIASIVTLTIFGVLSQLKIWKIVQARREKKDLERSDEERQRDEEEAEIGRELEANQAQERKAWERIYGDKKFDSVTSSEIKSAEKSLASNSIDEVGDMAEAPIVQPATTIDSQRSSTESKNNGRQLVVAVAADDITPAVSDESQAQTPYGTGPSSSAATSVSSVERAISKGSGKTKMEGPPIVPLPFTIPQEDIQRDEADSNSDVSLANTRHSSEGNPKKDYSFTPLRPPLKTSKRLSILTSTSVEAQVDDLAGIAQSSPLIPEFPFEEDILNSVSPSEPEASQHSPDVANDVGDDYSKPAPFLQEPSIVPSDGMSETGSQYWPLQSEKRSSLDSIPRSRRASQAGSIVEEQEIKADSAAIKNLLEGSSLPNSRASESSQESSEKFNGETDGSLERVLSKDKASKVVLQFRTNEWAKHLENAEKPGPDEIVASVPMSEEPVSVVNQEELLQTPLTAQPAPAPATIRQPDYGSAPKGKPERISTSKQRHDMAKNSGFEISETTNKQRPEVPRSASSSSHLASKRVSMRSESKRQSQRSPFLPFQASRNSLIASPIAEDAVASFPPNPSPSPQNTSRARRSQRTSRRSVTDPLLSLAHYRPQSQVNPQLSSPNAEIAAALSNENLPLSQRRSYLQNSGSNSQARSPGKDTQTPAVSAYLSQPSRQQTHPQQQPQSQTVPEHTLRRASMLAEWRRSKAMENNGMGPRNTPSPASSNSIPAFQPPDQGPAAASRYGPQANSATWGSWTQLGGTGLNSKPDLNVGKGMVDSALYSGKDRTRRTSGMSAKEVNDAHREVLRRMQAGANKALARDDR